MSTDAQWADELTGADMGGLVEAVTDPLAHLAEKTPEGRPGDYWERTPSYDDAVEQAYDRAVEHALRALEDLLAVRPAGTRAQKPDAVARAQRREALLLAAVDRALADPRSGYLKRLRVRRSALLRERVAAGTSVKRLAVELGVSEQRVYALLNNNRVYVSASRALALEALREQGEQTAAARKAERDAERAQAAAERASARAAEGRALQARLDAGATRAEIQVATGYSRQKLANLLVAASAAGVAA